MSKVERNEGIEIDIDIESEVDNQIDQRYRGTGDKLRQISQESSEYYHAAKTVITVTRQQPNCSCGH